MSTTARRRLVSYGFLLINTLCWGAALIIVKPAFDYTTPFRFLFYRYLIAIVLTLPILWYYRTRLPKRPPLLKQLSVVTAAELVGTGLSLGALYLGLARTSAIEASLIITTSPIILTLLGVWLLRERQEKHEWLGLVVAFAGTLGLTIVPALNQNTSTVVNTTLLGNLLVFLNNVLTAGYFIAVKKAYTGWPKLFLTTISFYVGAVFFGLLSWAELGFGNWSNIQTTIASDLTHPSVWIASGYMAIFGSIIGLTAYIKGQDGIEASEASLFWYLQPLVYIPLGMLLLGESANALQLGMLGVILVGVLIAEKRWRRQRPAR